MTTILEIYMREAGIDDASLGEQIGKDRTTVSRLRRGILKPTLEVAAAIESVTDGAVPIRSWIDTADTTSPMRSDQSHPFPKRVTA